MREQLRVPSGPVRLADHDPGEHRGVPSGKAGKPKNLVTDSEALGGLQERLHAEALGGGARRSVLLVLQGTDTAGKGGVVTHVFSSFQPLGVEYTGWKKPTVEEAAHHFLWRIRKRLPRPGIIGVFDRSHYEDVLVPRVHGYADAAEIETRYREINAFEQELVDGGTAVIKCMLHISRETQGERLAARLDDPSKYWKFNPGDLSERVHWDDYQRAYEAALTACNTDAAPWYLVPADSKKYRNWAIAQLMQETLTAMDPQYPPPEFDIEEQKAALRAQG